MEMMHVLEKLNVFNEEFSLRSGRTLDPWYQRGRSFFRKFDDRRRDRVIISDEACHVRLNYGSVFKTLAEAHRKGCKGPLVVAHDMEYSSLDEFIRLELAHLPPAPTANSRAFYVMREYNDWEQETWMFYFPKQGNERFAMTLAKRLLALDGMRSVFAGIPGYKTEFSPYELNPWELVHEEKVDWLVGKKRRGFMRSDNKLEGKMDLGSLKSGQELFDQLYKGGLQSLVTS